MRGIAAILLAAGRGTRFGGEAKMLADLAGEPLVRHAARTALESEAAPVLVVLGHEAKRVEAALGGLMVRFVQNPAFADGLSTSLRAGFRVLPPETAGAFVLLGDLPLVAAGTLGAIAAAWDAAGRPAAAIPVHAGRRGNPALLSAALAGEIATLAGDEGAGRLLKERSDVIEVEVATASVLEDADTEAALAALRTRTAWGLPPGA